MKQILFSFLLIVLILAGCRSGKKIPDVSGMEVPLETIRFEKSFFKLDTLHIKQSLQALNQQYPGFTQDFVFNILGSSPDSVGRDIPAFISSYAPMDTAAEQIFQNFGEIEKQVKRGLQFVKYYFPAYKLPHKLISFIGPINSYGNIITKDALAVGLQMYMGKDYPLYLSDQGQQMYPRFISRRFEPAYIPVNCIRNIIDDMYPNKSLGKPMVAQMVEAGKRMYLTDMLLPGLADTLKTGYTAQQLNGCYASEKNIWSFFVQNDMLFNTDPDLTRDYLNDGPNTPALGEASPGNIGLFVGWQIVKKWMEQNPGTQPDALMKKNPKDLFEESKYKPR